MSWVRPPHWPDVFKPQVNKNVVHASYSIANAVAMVTNAALKHAFSSITKTDFLHTSLGKQFRSVVVITFA